MNMIRHKYTCCICGADCSGWGNDPWGTLNKKGEQIKWNPEDECCDECNSKYTIKGRMALSYKVSLKDLQVICPEILLDK